MLKNGRMPVVSKRGKKMETKMSIKNFGSTLTKDNRLHVDQRLSAKANLNFPSFDNRQKTVQANCNKKSI